MPCHSEVKKRTWKRITQTLGRSQVTDSSEMLLIVLFSPPRISSLRRRPLGGADGGSDSECAPLGPAPSQAELEQLADDGLRS